MSKHKNRWLNVDFPNKTHKEIKLVAQVTGLSFCSIAVRAMRLGLKEIMKQDKETLKGES